MLVILSLQVGSELRQTGGHSSRYHRSPFWNETLSPWQEAVKTKAGGEVDYLLHVILSVMSDTLLDGPEVETVIFFLSLVHVNLWEGFRGFILLAFHLNSPRKVKPSVNFCFSFAHR